MAIQFSKYQGTGNDFVMIDNRLETFPKNDTALVSRLCDRKFGIGADGLILIEPDKNSDFEMIYYNSDGRPGTMCGNGGRCAVAFAKRLGMVQNSARFNAADGIHHAEILADGNIALRMQDVDSVQKKDTGWFVDTGSPHHIEMVNGLEGFDVFTRGSQIRHNVYGEQGSNVNFVEQRGADQFFVRTFERGVEDETFSCGTGATAVALAMYDQGLAGSTSISIRVPGGSLMVTFDKIGTTYTNIVLSGPAELVFDGTLS